MPKPTTRKPLGPHRASGVRTAAALLRGLVSLAVLLALLGALPVLLWWATALVGPPALAALGSLLSTDDSGQVFLLALAAVGWAGWTLFACAVLLEIPAQLRGRAAPQIRGLVGQRAAAALVGAILLALPTGTALAAPAAAAPASASALNVSATAIPGTPAGSTADTGAASAGEQARTGSVTHTVRDVRPAESLWSIAEQTLGDGERWTDIAALNEGRTMADGNTFHADRPIQPGWTLTLPTDAVTAPSAEPQAHDGLTPVTANGHSEYRVREGDSLSLIADEQLGDADRFQEIFNLNQGKPMPDGSSFTNPDLIYPGQQLTLPQAGGTAQAPEPAPASPTPAQSQPGETIVTLAPAPPAVTPPIPTPSTAPAHTPAPTKPASPAPLPQQPTPAPVPNPANAPTTAAPRAGATASSVNWAMVAGIGTLLAASLAGALGVRRVLQQRRRRAGQTIAQDSDPTTLEQLLGAAEAANVELLDQILRTLAHRADRDGRTLPALRGVHLAAGSVTLLLDEPAESIAPFIAGPDALTWALDRQAVLVAAEDLQDVEAPYPGLVTLGGTAEGLLLADLMTCRVLLLDGTPDEVLEVARALALELGTCKWTDYSEILTAGLGTRLAGLLPQGRVRTMPHLPAVAADLGALLLEAHQSGEQVLPWLLIAAGEYDQEQLTQLADALTAGRRLQTAVVLPATPATRRAFPHAEILDATRDQDAHLDALGLPMALQRVTDEQYRQYIHALEVSTQDPAPATGAWGFTESHQQPAATGQPLTLRVTSQDAQDPGNPFPALLAGLTTEPTTPPAPSVADTSAEEPVASGEEPQKSYQGSQAAVPRQAAGPADSETPGSGVCVEILGPLRINGVHCAHAPRTTALAALIHLRPGRTVDYLCQAMDPVNPWSPRTLQSRLSELRSGLGTTEDGQPLLPRPKSGTGYAFHPSVTSDWAQFKALAARGLAAGPGAGTAHLEAAMALVRGKPFAGRTLPWADPIIQEVLSRITDTAHTLARWHTDGESPDHDAARQVVSQGLDVEETSEVLYRDLLHIEWTTDNHTSVRKTISRLQQMARTYDISLDDATKETINRVLSQNPSLIAQRITS
ncbi:LysM peptidoglycan-binding domain-containing protein [Streptomyces sp. NPDC060028]|uniref:LysM peptidoglycan-binding domain-containing protein n=1 Tax=Streptomyces sp. NPDC060028 TaxID=3347041 RepID=UPI0036BE63A4